MKLPALMFLAIAACGPSLQSITLVNGTNRSIEEVYVYPTGSANHGASRGAISAGASTKLSIPKGNIEVMAVSAKVKVEDHVNERRTASSAIELKHPVEVVFYDEGSKPANLARTDVVGVSFTTDKEPAKPATPPPVDPEPVEPNM